MNEESEQEIRSRRRWRVRRRMAKTSFVAGLGYPLLCIAEPRLLEALVPFYSFITGVIVVYIGGGAYEDSHLEGGA